ncbi:putative Ribosomal RNA processing protein 1 [Daphnia magna]|uniref:Putative Ribosomal RNA processing protein 1 n=1 Tax=Daphnia magna TaxID=35525 RepID=A0A164Z0X1_9CRUS|nr:putative Ribosomal RNA processing protein 1 [Daphnia magna]
MSDKPLIQEDLAETISGLVHSIVDRMTGLKFVTTALKTMARDWSGIDTWRMDKFLMVFCEKDYSAQFRISSTRRLEERRSRCLFQNAIGSHHQCK